MAKDETYVKLINTARWLRLRKAVLSAHPCCERCGKDGFITPATEVHHAVPVETGITEREKETLMFDPSNLMALCHACHVAVHTEMGRSGKEATKKRNEQQAKDIIERFFPDT